MNVLTNSIIGVTFGLVIVMFWQVIQAHLGIGRVERKLDVLLKHSGLDLTQVVSQEVQALMRAGKKIEAIRLYRELTGAGLAEAKAAVESLP